MITKTIGATTELTLRGYWKGENDTVDSIGGNSAIWYSTPGYEPGVVGNCFAPSDWLGAGNSGIYIPHKAEQAITAENAWETEFCFNIQNYSGGNVGQVFGCGDGPYGDADDLNLEFSLGSGFSLIVKGFYSYQTATIQWNYDVQPLTWYKIRLRSVASVWSLWINDIEIAYVGTNTSTPTYRNLPFWFANQIYNTNYDEIKIFTNYVDYPDLNSAIIALEAIGDIADDYLFELVSDIDNVTSMAFSEIRMHAHTLDFNLNGFTILNHKQIIFPIRRSVYMTPGPGLGHLKIRNGKIFTAADCTIGDQIKIWYGTSKDIVEGQLVTIEDMLFSDHLNSNSSTQYPLVLWQDAGWSFLHMKNVRMYKHTPGFGIYIAGNGGFDPGLTSRFKKIENCSIYSVGQVSNIMASTGSDGLYADFKNVVSAGSALTSFRNFQYTDNAGVSFINCADSDNTITSQDTGTVHGVTDADFVSVDPTSDDFLKLSPDSALRGAGTPNISDWNTADFRGRPRPTNKNTASIGVSEDIAADVTLSIKVWGLWFSKTKEVLL